MIQFLFGVAAVASIGVVLLVNAIQFHTVAASDYRTPWYSASWLREPYTNAVLAFYPAKEYWTENAIGSERWLVREHAVGNVTFWTTLERIPK